ncbi:MAG TPA: hypothetical protein VJH92_03905 [Candidatus Nanoarchaeia archaeon]|nr:hypothetical protein [Candidatus Nanoarchaeia archaeon]
MAEPNPVLGFSIVKDKKYKRDCEAYRNMIKRILNTELDIVGWPERSPLLHAPLHRKCEGYLHARVDQNLRILYKPDYKDKIIFLERLLNHREMERKCD